MQKQQNNPTVEPIELNLEDLEHVSGGTPKGGWGPADAPIADDAIAAAVSVDPTPTPKGGW